MLYLLTHCIRHTGVLIMLPIIIFCAFKHVHAETLKSNSFWEELHRQFNHLEQLMQQPDDTLSRVNQLMSQHCSTDWNNRAEVAAMRAEARHLDSHNGINLNTGYTSAELGNSTENDTGNTYVEVSWDLLKDGWQDYNYRALDKQREAEISLIEGQMRRQLHQARCRRFKMDDAFREQSSQLYTAKLSVLELLVSAGKHNYLNGHSYLDDYLALELQLQQARTRLSQLNASSAPSAFTSLGNLPILTVNLPALLETVRNDPRQLELENLRQARAQEQNRFRDGTKLRVFLRQRLETQNNNDDGVVGGVRLSIPIHNGQHDARVYLHEQLVQDASLERWERITQIRAHNQSLEEQLERTIEQQYRYLRSLERTRRALTGQQLGQQTDIALAATQLNTLFDAAIELNEAKETLYRRINEVFLVAGISFSPQYLTELPVTDQNTRARAGERTLYLWSPRFNSLSNQELMAFFKARQIRHVLLSAGQNTNRSKALKLVKLARDNGIQISAMLGDANWIKPEKANSAIIQIAAAYELSDQLHLDIEPHTLDDYTRHKAAYLAQYLKLLDQVNAYTGYDTLSVSVPLHWPNTVYRALSGKVDSVYLMAYDQPSPELRLKKIKQVLAELKPEQAVIALNVTEFNSPAALDEEIRRLKTATGVHRFALHAFDDLLKITQEARP